MFLIVIAFLSILIIVLLFILLYKNYFKRNINLNSFKIKFPSIIGTINIFIIIFYAIWFMINIIKPQSNSGVDNNINFSILLFSLISGIFILLPFSISSIIISIILWKKKIISKILYLYGLIINVVVSIVISTVFYYMLKNIY